MRGKIRRRLEKVLRHRQVSSDPLHLLTRPPPSRSQSFILASRYRRTNEFRIRREKCPGSPRLLNTLSTSHFAHRDALEPSRALSNRAQRT